MAKIAVYLTGSVAAYKGIEVVRGLQKMGHTVRVAMTNAACQLVSSATLFALTKETVLTDLWDEHDTPIPHIELADWSDLAVVVPATANIIAKMATGIADDAVSTTLLATAAPKVVVPAMNSHMWFAPATQRNVRQLLQDGVILMPPVAGRLAEGYRGQGRLPEPTDICRFVTSVLNQQQLLAGKRVVVTAGGTREEIDPVRFIGNRSSGKMGIAIAKAAANAGAKVILIAGQVTVPLPTSPQIDILRVTSTEDLLTVLKQEFTRADALIMAAAVADYRPLTPAAKKIKKRAGDPNLVIKLTETVDVLKTIAQDKRAGQVVVGFAAETNDLLENANRKLRSKHADFIVANSVAKNNGAFGSDTNQVTILEGDKEPQKWPRLSKNEVASKLIELLRTKLK